MQTCVGQNCGHAYNSMELFHAIDFLTCQPSITWNSFQAITHHTNLPCYYHLYISRLLQGCIFHALSWRPLQLTQTCSREKNFDADLIPVILPNPVLLFDVSIEGPTPRRTFQLVYRQGGVGDSEGNRAAAGERKNDPTNERTGYKFPDKTSFQL